MQQGGQLPGTFRGSVIIIRGHSGSGKSTVANEVMRRLRLQGDRVCHVDEDYVRWEMPGLNKNTLGDSASTYCETFTKDHVIKFVNEMIYSQITTAINCDFNVVIEGILSLDRFSELFERLQRVPNLLCHFVYLDVPLGVTLERHRGRDKSKYIPESDVIKWRKNEDERTQYPNELAISGATTSLADSVDTIIDHVNLRNLSARSSSFQTATTGSSLSLSESQELQCNLDEESCAINNDDNRHAGDEN